MSIRFGCEENIGFDKESVVDILREPEGFTTIRKRADDKNRIEVPYILVVLCSGKEGEKSVAAENGQQAGRRQEDEEGRSWRRW